MAHLLGGAPLKVLLRLGFERDRIDLLKKVYESEGQRAAARFVTEKDVAKLSIVGSAGEVAERVKEMAAKNIDEFVVLSHVGRSLAGDIENMSRFGRDVMPLVC